MENGEKISQNQFYDLLTSKELSWQAIIYDLIKSEQLNPWDIDLAVLAKKYLEKIREIQELEEGTFFISSKVLLAAAIMLKLKANLLHNNIKDIDEILFNKNKAKNQTDQLVGANQIIDFAEEKFPQILPRTPLPRGRKVTLKELMSALNNAINTEHRRIKKEIAFKRIRTNIDFVLPKKKVDIKQKIHELFLKIKDFFTKKRKLTYTLLVGEKRDDKISCFLPLLYLSNQGKIFIEQEKPFSEIEILLKQKMPKLPKPEKESEEKKTEEDSKNS